MAGLEYSEKNPSFKLQKENTNSAHISFDLDRPSLKLVPTTEPIMEPTQAPIAPASTPSTAFPIEKQAAAIESFDESTEPFIAAEIYSPE